MDYETVLFKLSLNYRRFSTKRSKEIRKITVNV